MMGAPQIIVIVITAMSLGLIAAKHGEQRDEKYNFWVSLISQLIAFALLWWGGFFG